MPLMGFREYARHRGVALRAVQKAVAAGRIVAIGEGRERKIDSDAADQAWLANTDPAKQSLLYTAGGPNPESGAKPAAAGDGGPAVGDDTAEYRAARASRETVRLESEQLDLAAKRGTLVDLRQAKRLVFTAFRSLRDATLQVPSRVKDQCAAMTDAYAIEQLLDAELTAVFGGFDQAKALREADDDDDDDAD